MTEPLASKLRPETLRDFVGQKHLVGKDKPFSLAVKNKNPFSFILWGPPGVGKTTLARIYARALDLKMVELSAVSAGKDDIKKVLSIGFEKPTVLFLDEIHRFNKSQQDFLLPFVESGRLILIGATTENPSFEVIPALLSRCRVFVLENLTESDIGKIIKRAGIETTKDIKEKIYLVSGGDARRALSLIDQTKKIYNEVTEETLSKVISLERIRYDKKGDEHYNTVSAFIKSMRAGNPDATLYYLARMIEGGEDPKFIARRMIIFASEDVGLAQPTALVLANEVFKAVEVVGLPEARINLAHGAVYLAEARKDRRAYEGINEALSDVKKYGNLPIPKKILNAPTKLLKNLDYGKGYEKYDKKDLLPDKLKNKKYLKDK